MYYNTVCGRSWVWSRSGQTKVLGSGICCFSAKHPAFMCPSGVTCLSVDCCFSELPL